MKKLCSIAVLFICLLQSGGLMLIYQIRQCSIQLSTLDKIFENNAQLIELTLSISDFQKNKVNEHEISINGKYYDFKTIKREGNLIRFKAFNDVDEEEIIRLIETLINNKELPNGELPYQLHNLLTLDYVCPGTQCDFTNNQNVIRPFQLFNEDVIFFSSETSSPPPKLG